MHLTQTKKPTLLFFPAALFPVVLCATVFFSAALVCRATAAPAATTAPAPAAPAVTRPVDLANDRNLFLVAYSHLDTQWRWALPVTIREYLPATINNNLALIEKYPGFIINFTGARRYMMMREYYPDAFARVKAQVAAGRWFPAGSCIEETDALVPSAESQIRNILYGNGYFLREFGVASDEHMLPDSAGFPASLPTILAHAGIKGFSTQKLAQGSAAAIPFDIGLWLGIDGSPVLAALNPGKYTGKIAEDLSQNADWLARINATGEKSGAFAAYHYYGTGDRGGAPDENSVLWAERSAAGKGPVRVIPGRADDLFNALAKLPPAQLARLPHYQGDLLLTGHSAGTLTSQACMKRWNRKNELLADAAERAATAALWLAANANAANAAAGSAEFPLGGRREAPPKNAKKNLGAPRTTTTSASTSASTASTTSASSTTSTNAIGAAAPTVNCKLETVNCGGPAAAAPAAAYPAEKLRDAWTLLIGAQSHDDLPGACLPEACEFAWNDEILAANQFAAVAETAVATIASALDTRGAHPRGATLIVCNPLSIAREDIVEATIPAPPFFLADNFGSIAATGPDGAETPVHILDIDPAGNLHITFLAATPPVSFNVFDIHPSPQLALLRPTELTVTRDRLENARYRVTINPAGDIASIFDKLARRELLAAPARIEFLHEKPQQFPAWNMDWADRQKPPRAILGAEGAPAKITIVESGPVRAALRIEREAEGSRITQTLRLAAGGAGDRLECLAQIDWQTRESSLKAAFTLTTANPLATYDSQAGAIQRGNNNGKKFEVPQQQWLDLTDPAGAFGVAILNDSKYGSDKPSDTTVRLTLLYTPGVREGFQDQATQDLGHHEMLYAITSHTGDWRAGRVPQEAARLNQPLLAFTTAQHPGALGKSLSLLQTSDENIAITAIKKAEATGEIIVRLRELSGHPRRDIRLTAAAPITAAREVDGQERPLAEKPWNAVAEGAPATGDTALQSTALQNGALVFDIDGYALKAFALRLAPPPPGAAPAPITAQPIPLAYDEDVVSPNTNRADGAFDTEGRAYPAEQFPARLTSEDIPFTLGPVADGQPNALAARGQTIALPAAPATPAGRTNNRLHLLAAADGDCHASFAIDGRPIDLTIQNWTGFIGQWDNRLWDRDPPKVAYTWNAKLTGLAPGYTKRDTVAWYATHRHTPAGDEPWHYSYIFKYRIDLPPGAKTLTLPDDPRIRIFAMTIADNPRDTVHPAAPLYDTLDVAQAASP